MQDGLIQGWMASQLASKANTIDHIGPCGTQMGKKISTITKLCKKTGSEKRKIVPGMITTCQSMQKQNGVCCFQSTITTQNIYKMNI